MKYQIDIDGLRALAVLSVVFFHLGFLPNGYLGVDVFFVISGYLITSKIYFDKNFSLKDFYKGRVRRILPLAFFISLVAIIIGFFVMLPDDLENLAQSVIATNFSLNNILLLSTTGDYWNVINEYKPLMHSWSLGVEEQFYIFYPLIFLLSVNNNIKKSIIVLVSIISLLLFFYINNPDFVFFTIFTRFWEISIGGVLAIFFDKTRINSNYKNIFSILLLIIIFNLSPFQNDRLNLFLAILCSLLLVLKDNGKFKIWYSNKVFRLIGKISFSIYLWHQLILAFYRYVFTEKFTLGFVILYLLMIFILSLLTYYLIENKYRNYKQIPFRKLSLHLSLVFLLSTVSSSFIIYTKGIVRDIPELDVKFKDFSNTPKHSEYNERIYNYTNKFSDSETKKILIIGDSHARDFANVLLASEFSPKIEIRYVNSVKNNPLNLDKSANIIFFCREDGVKTVEVNFIKQTNKVPIYIVGTKNFGENSGKFYNRGDKNKCNHSASLSDRIILINKNLSEEWNKSFIDITLPVRDNNDFVPIFTPNCRFISQDTKHFTRDGAEYFSEILESELKELIFKNLK